jgi:hypothetical protein
LKIDCLEPLLTTMLSALTARPPESSDSRLAMAARSSAMPMLAA